jgi:flagellar biogenesis protein FliO
MQRLLNLSLIAIALLFVIAGTSIAADKAASSVQSSNKSVSAAGNAKGTADSGADFLSEWETREKQPKETQEQSTPMLVIGFILKLALVLGLCYLSILGLKRFSSLKTSVGPVKGTIHVVENASIGANRSLHVVVIGSKRLLVASTPNQVNLLTELEPVEITEVQPEASRTPVAFKDQLTQFLGHRPDDVNSADNVAQMLRTSNSYMQDKVREVGSFRGAFRNADTQ